MFSKLSEIEPELNPSYKMVDFEKAAINALEEHFIAVVSGCFFHSPKLFEANYIGIKLPNQTSRVPPFPIRY